MLTKLQKVCLLCFLLLPGKLFSQSICAPATLQHLSEVRNLHQFTLEQWIQNCHNDDKLGTDVQELASAWKRFEPNTKLVSIYQLIGIEGIPYDANATVQDNHYYIWIGIRQGGKHCCLMYHSGSHFILVHSQKCRNGNYFTQVIDDKEFFGSTMAVIDLQ